MLQSSVRAIRDFSFRPKVAQNVMRVPCPLVLRPGVGDARSIERRTCSLPGSEGSSRGTSAEGLSAIALRSAGRACLRGREGGMEGSRGVRARGVRAISRGRWNWKERPARRPTGGGTPSRARERRRASDPRRDARSGSGSAEWRRARRSSLTSASCARKRATFVRFSFCTGDLLRVLLFVRGLLLNSVFTT